jgi:large subunit ribosomal protein L9
MAQELILLEDVAELGRMGDTVRVAEGYARNYLLPRGLATHLSPGAQAQLAARKRQRQLEYEQQIETAEELAGQIAEHSISIPVQATEDDKLYGSVTAQQISDALQAMNVNIDRKQVALAEPIRELGVYNVEVHLHPEVTAMVKVWVVKA